MQGGSTFFGKGQPKMLKHVTDSESKVSVAGWVGVGRERCTRFYGQPQSQGPFVLFPMEASLLGGRSK